MKTIQNDDESFWLFSQETHIHLVNNNLPFGRAAQYDLAGATSVYIGDWQGKPLNLVLDKTPPSPNFLNLRSQLSLPEKEFYLLNRGVELNYFFHTHQFCGKCGGKTQKATNEWAVQCENEACSHRTYPVICPSIIVAVRRGKELLLANHLNNQGKVYTTIAGFVEVGETFEQAVHREVQEETGVQVKNLRYFGSQPWAFPNAQMVGFLADYAGGEIKVQETELRDAQWFHCDEPLPELPAEGTIALKLIQHSLQLCAKEGQ